MITLLHTITLALGAHVLIHENQLPFMEEEEYHLILSSVFPEIGETRDVEELSFLIRAWDHSNPTEKVSWHLGQEISAVAKNYLGKQIFEEGNGDLLPLCRHVRFDRSWLDRVEFISNKILPALVSSSYYDDELLRHLTLGWLTRTQPAALEIIRWDRLLRLPDTFVDSGEAQKLRSYMATHLNISDHIVVLLLEGLVNANRIGIDSEAVQTLLVEYNRDQLLVELIIPMMEAGWRLTNLRDFHTIFDLFWTLPKANDVSSIRILRYWTECTDLMPAVEQVREMYAECLRELLIDDDSDDSSSGEDDFEFFAKIPEGYQPTVDISLASLSNQSLRRLSEALPLHVGWQSEVLKRLGGDVDDPHLICMALKLPPNDILTSFAIKVFRFAYLLTEEQAKLIVKVAAYSEELQKVLKNSSQSMSVNLAILDEARDNSQIFLHLIPKVASDRRVCAHAKTLGTLLAKIETKDLVLEMLHSTRSSPYFDRIRRSLIKHYCRAMEGPLDQQFIDQVNAIK